MLLHEVDIIFGDMRKDFQRRLKRISNVHATQLWLLTAVSLPVTYFFYLKERLLLKTVLYFYAGLFYGTQNALLVFFTSAVFIRVRNINMNLQLMLDQPEKDFKDQQNDVEKILKFIRIYGKLIEVNGLLNSCYGIVCMLSFGLLFFFSIFTIFMTFKDFSDDGRITGVTQASDVYGLFLLAFTTVLIYFCYIPRREGEKSVQLANKILKVTKNETKIQILIAFSTLVNREKFNFSCGLFDFNWMLVSGVSHVINTMKLNFYRLLASRCWHRHYQISLF